MELKIAGIVILACIAFVNCQGPTKDRVCATLKNADDCAQLQRGNSEVSCIFVQDAIECAQRIRNGTAEFGILTAENAFHMATLRYDGLAVIKELRHRDKKLEPFDFQSVVVVRSNHYDGVKNLREMDYCHPGLHQRQRHERWTEAFLKHFERQVVPYDCSEGETPSEIEAAALVKYFKSACRPGAWSHIEEEDKKLKEKYPALCELCDNKETCSYTPTPATDHQKALECMLKTENGLAYVAQQEALDFFTAKVDLQNNFQYLCPNGSYEPIFNNSNPCPWLKQPWSLVVSNNENSLGIAQRLQRWTLFGTSSWEIALTSILTSSGSNILYPVQNIAFLVDYVNPIRPIPADIGMCTTTSRWCTHSYEEKDKCDVLRAVALSTGIKPIFECNEPRTDTVSCISDVSTGKADLLGIDSNFGYLARHVYNLSTILYEETEDSRYSSVVAVIKESDAERITSFEDFRDKRACFPEYGGIASIAFINIAKGRGIFKREECTFGPLLASYFSDSCIPGSRSVFHDPTNSNPDNLCTLCQTQLVQTTTQGIVALAGEMEYDDGTQTTDGIEGDEEFEEKIPHVPNRSINCAASISNRFYGTRGALTCLNEVGDVAILEHQNLAYHANALNLKPDNFRILCRNGSLASTTGFDVDPSCFMTTIVDGEIVVNRNNSRNMGILNALISLDLYLQSDPDFKMYNIFSGAKDLLFEDSALGLVAPDSESLSKSVENYIQLFADVENCNDTDSAQQATFNLLLSLSLILFTILIRN